MAKLNLELFKHPSYPILTSNSYEMNNRVRKTHSTHRMICNNHMTAPKSVSEQLRVAARAAWYLQWEPNLDKVGKLVASRCHYHWWLVLCTGGESVCVASVAVVERVCCVDVF